jgi:hypothetical protein
LAEKETAMTTIDILYLAGIIGAFVVFAVVLAWVQFQTRHFDAARRTGQGGEGRRGKADRICALAATRGRRLARALRSARNRQGAARAGGVFVRGAHCREFCG